MATPKEKKTDADKFKDILLSAEEMKEVDKAANKYPAVIKLIKLHEAFTEKIIFDNIVTSLKYLAFLNDSMKEAMIFLSNKDNINLIFSQAEIDAKPELAEMPLQIAILKDKLNGIPERLKEIPKSQMETSKDIMEFIRVAKYLGAQIDDEILGNSQQVDKDFSWSDFKAKAANK
jgi:hypothetical protein